jgi:hypothetical protein
MEYLASRSMSHLSHTVQGKLQQGLMRGRVSTILTLKVCTFTGSSANLKTVDVARVSSTPYLIKTSSVKTIGIPGYVTSKYGIPRKEPNYTVPKDESQSFFKHVTRATKGNPAPSQYTRPMSWKTNNGVFGVGPARKTFTDEAAKMSKLIPSVHTYRPEIKRKLLLGQMR